MGLAILWCGCSAMQSWEVVSQDRASQADQSVDVEAENPAAPPIPVDDMPMLSAVQPRKVVYTGALKIATADVDQAVIQTKKLAEQLGGYMQQMTAETIVIRVPAAAFDQALIRLGQMGTVIAKQLTARDVTEQYEDLDIRLRNAKALLTKFHGLLQKTEDVKQVLAVEREMARVRTEIEKLQGRLNRMKSQLAYATLSVAFIRTERTPPEFQVRLPFWWLGRLGLDVLMEF
ncbi:hypothetical protein LCGC14_0094550 [marine sediment metagenome]|uniref:DUF4349 domain-containing protein n=1 Tax=marine sediment metagenome TaxID=412755 RepID=A0A0F9VHI8_9ZZZZ